MAERLQGIVEFQARGIEALDSANKKLDDITQTTRWTALASGVNAAMAVFNTALPIIQGVGRSMGGLATEAMADIDAFGRLDRTLARFGAGGAESIARVHAQVEILRQNTEGFGDATLALGLDRFILQVDDAGRAIENYGLVVDVAARLTGGDLASAAKIVAFAMEGEFMQLSRLLPEVKQFARDNEALAGTAEGAAFAIRTLRDTVGGGAAEERNTLRGAVSALKDELGESRETLGKGLFSADSVTQINMMTIAVRDITAQTERIMNNPMVRAFFSGSGNAAAGVVGIWARMLGIDVGSLRQRATAIDYTNAPSQDVPGAPPSIRGGNAPASGPAAPFFNQGPFPGANTDQRGNMFMQAVDISKEAYEQIAANYADAYDAMDARGEQWVAAEAMRHRAASAFTQATSRATADVVMRLLMRDRVERLKGLDVIKFVAAKGTSAVLSSLAEEAAAKGALAAADAAKALFEGNFAAAAGLGATALKYGILAGALGGTAGAISAGAQREFDRSGGGGGSQDAGLGPTGGAASNGIRALNAATGPTTVNYIVNVTYSGAVIYGSGGTRDWYRRELLPLIRESREMGELAA